MCVYRLAGSEKPVATTAVIRRTGSAALYALVRRERNAKATAYVVYRNRSPVTEPVVRRLKFAPTARVRVRKVPPSTKKVNVCVRPGRCWLTTNANPSFVPVRVPTTPVPTFTAINVALDVLKMAVAVITDIVKITARKEPFIDIMTIEKPMDVLSPNTISSVSRAAVAVPPPVISETILVEIFVPFTGKVALPAVALIPVTKDLSLNIGIY